MKVFVKVKPKASRNTVKKVDGIHFTVWIKEAPEKGRANEAVIKLLAEYFGAAPSQIRLVSGFSLRGKVFEIL